MTENSNGAVTDDALLMWVTDLKAQHDHVKTDMLHEDDYQLGYLHGLNYAIEYLSEYLPDPKGETHWVIQLLADMRKYRHGK